MPYTILVGAYTDVITTVAFDPAANPPSLQVIGKSAAGTNPSWVAVHPSDSTLVFACNEEATGTLKMFRRTETGLTLLQTAWTSGRDPAHFAVGEKEVVVGNYSSGSLITIPLDLSDAANPKLLAQTTKPVEFRSPGIGPVPERQEEPHPHQVAGDILAGRELLIPDLGSDRVWRMTRDKTTSAWDVGGEIQVPAGKGPRHLVVAGNVLYVLNELDSTLTAYTYGDKVAVTEIKTLSLLAPPAKPAEGMLGAELLYAPASASFPEPLLYASNRNDPHPEGDSIAIYSIQNGLELVGEVRTGLKHLRAVAFGGEEDRYLVIGGMNGGGIKAFERVGDGRSLKEIAHLAEEEVPKPTSFVIV